MIRCLEKVYKQKTDGGHSEAASGHHFAGKGLKGRHFCGSKSHSVVRWIGNPILPHFYLLQSYVALPEGGGTICQSFSELYFEKLDFQQYLFFGGGKDLLHPTTMQRM